MVKAIIFLEGGGDSNELKSRCRKGFHKLLISCGFTNRLPTLKPCGGRHRAFDQFKTEVKKSNYDFVGLWIDSEDPLDDLEATWEHLLNRDNWEKPEDATDGQVLFMTTCMETWIVADRETLKKHFGSDLQLSALLPLKKLEERTRKEVLESLEHATRNCSNAYKKGKRSFEILGKLSPTVLEHHLPSFVRVVRILKDQL
ncbi:MAG: DUF4276 family protein [Acidobacteria bacterium]|nr:DUF4276 family protein [Acidobacteriota bacterium]